VVGDEGTIFKTTDRGVTWVQKPSRTDFDLNAVSFGSVTTGAAVGEGGPGNVQGMLVGTSDGGETWTRAPMGNYQALYDVSFASPTVAVAVGRSKVIMRTTNGGATWAVQTFTPNSPSYFAVTFGDNLHGTIGGEAGEILHTTDGGLTWVPQTSGYLGSILDLNFIDASYGMAASGTTLLRTTTGGSSWTTILPDSVRQPGTLSMISRDSVVMAGWFGFLGGSIDGGYTWSPLQWKAFTVDAIGSIVSLSPNLWLVNASVSQIFRTTDAGETWMLVDEGLPGECFIKMAVLDSATAFVVGDDGLIKRTTDTGLTWSARPSGSSSFLWDANFVEEGIGVAVGTGGTILRTSDQGNTWESQPSPTTSVLRAVSLIDASTGFTVGGDDGIIMKTTDGGSNWTILQDGTVQPLVDVHFTDSMTGTVVGSGGTILQTTDGGATWTQQVFSGENFSLVEFFDTNIGIVVGDSSILRTTDGGSTWINEYPAIGINVLLGMTLNIGGYDYIIGSGGLMMRRFREDYGNFSPVISDIPDQTIVQGGRFAPIRVDNYVSDPDDPDSSIAWSWSGNVNLRVNWNPTRRRIVVRPPSAWTGTETITFTATDPDGLSDSDEATFTVTVPVTEKLASLEDQAELFDGIPQSVVLLQNYPNPFNPTTTIQYRVPWKVHVRLEVYNVLGQRIAVLVDEEKESGYHTATFDGVTIPSGLYFYRLQAGNFIGTRKLTLMR
jgi:photosystem II stability/assembly factor-like uncharacterized protein